MATVTISAAGSAVVTGSKAFTVSDADISSILAWAKIAYDPYIQATFNPNKTPGFTPTNQQILLAWIQSWVNGTRDAVQRFQTAAPAVPPPITFG